jgi:hypothetical protein
VWEREERGGGGGSGGEGKVVVVVKRAGRGGRARLATCYSHFHPPTYPPPYLALRLHSCLILAPFHWVDEVRVEGGKAGGGHAKERASESAREGEGEGEREREELLPSPFPLPPSASLRLPVQRGREGGREGGRLPADSATLQSSSSFPPPVSPSACARMCPPSPLPPPRPPAGPARRRGGC